MSQLNVPIFYACDDNFVKFTIVSLYSMRENASPERTYQIHILHTGITEENQAKVMELERPNFRICFENVKERVREIGGHLPIRHYYSMTTYYRMFIADMFPEYDKVLYIDSDTVVQGDISELYDIEIGDCLVGAAHEEAMRQSEIFGDYCEKVVGVDREQFFNAGVLIINTRLYREEKILDRFKALLYTYRFVVTQDEDYLNVLCKDRVYHIPSKWNCEMFGEISCTREEAAIIHYIMVSKPWHFEDCTYGDVFWKYATQTGVCEELKEILASYTDLQREADFASAKNLEEMALAEIAREDGYYNLISQKDAAELDRLIILNKIAQYEKEGRFDEDVEEDPPTRELLPDEIDYLRRKVSSKIKARFAYSIARRFMNSLIDDKKMIIKEIRGLEHYKNLDSGAIITCNHFNAYDSFAMQIAYEAAGHRRKRKLFRVIREGNYTNFPGFYGILMRNCNTFPLSSNVQTMRKFMDSMDKVLKDGHFMLIYPEQSMWWNYRKPKPLKSGAYKFAVRNNVPVLPCFITMEDSDIKDETGFFVQEYTIHIGAPIYPNKSVDRRTAAEQMSRKNYEVWKNIYEETYHESLTYTCGKVN